VTGSCASAPSLRAIAFERELDEELSFHVERETHKLVEQGMDPDEARLKARARFGSAALAAGRCRLVERHGTDYFPMDWPSRPLTLRACRS
jgi:hypothetical protein